VKFSKPEDPGTEQQNRFMHSLLTAYYKTGMHSAPERYTLAEFKIYMKVQFGLCYEMEIRGKLTLVPVSWTDYNKEERQIFIDGLLSEILQVVCPLTKEIEEIIRGAET
jgi:hypothetical protein